MSECCEYLPLLTETYRECRADGSFLQDFQRYTLGVFAVGSLRKVNGAHAPAAK